MAERKRQTARESSRRRGAGAPPTEAATDARPNGVAEQDTATPATTAALMPDGARRWKLLRPELLVLLATIVAAALRFYRLGDIPPALNQDEAVNGYDAYSLFLTGRDHLGHAFPFAGLESLGDWASPLLTFLTVPAVGLFGLKLEVIRAVPALMGTLAVPVVYQLAVELFGQRLLAVVAAWLLALSPFHISLSHWAIPPTLVPTMVALTLLALVWSVNRASKRGIVVTGIVAGLTIASYPTMKLYLPLIGLVAAAIYWRELLRIKWEALLYAAIAIVLIAGPIYYLSLRDPGGRGRLQQESIFQPGVRVDAALLAKQYLAYLSPHYLFVQGSDNPLLVPDVYGVELRALGPLLVLGLLGLFYGLVRGRLRPGDTQFAWLRWQPAALLLAALVCYPVPGMLTKSTVHALRGAQFIPVAALLAALGVAIASQGIVQLLATPRLLLAQGALATLLLLPSVPELLGHYRYYYTKYADTVVWHYQYGLQQAFEFAQAREADYDEVWIDRTNQPYIYVLFFTRADPNKVHNELRVQRQPPYFNSITSYGKYRFGNPFGNTQTPPLPVLYSISRPAGQARYEVRGGMYNGKKMLVVRVP